MDPFNNISQGAPGQAAAVLEAGLWLVAIGMAAMGATFLCLLVKATWDEWQENGRRLCNRLAG